MLEWVSRLKNKRVVVVGDLVADEYVYGVTSRISREAPVLVVRYSDHAYKLGGAANAANNVHALGGKVVPVGVVGRDEAGRHVRRLLGQAKMPVKHVLQSGRATTLKTRILAGGVHTTKQQVLRLDREDTTAFDAATQRDVARSLTAAAASADAILVSDYGLGVVSPPVRKALSDLAAKGVIVCVDSRFDVLSFKGVTAVTPNEPEAEAAFGRPLDDDKRVDEAGRHLQSKIAAKAVLITRGRKGMVLFEGKRAPTLIPIAGTDEVSDVTGAGDTVIATFTLALAAGAPFEVAARLANFAASVTVMKVGAATCSPAELRRAMGAG